MSKARVLVVDDQNISRGFFEMYVRASSDYELVAGLRTAQSAMDFVDKNEVDLLIMDVMMQEGIDGLTAATTIKQKQPGIKIILATSTSETTWEQKARDAGIESFWYKEYDEHSLIELMDRTLKGENVYPDESPNVPFGKITRADLTDRELDILRELTSSKTSAGFWVSTASTAETPSFTMMGAYPSLLRYRRSSSQILTSSSTIRIFSFIFSFPPYKKNADESHRPTFLNG